MSDALEMGCLGSMVALTVVSNFTSIVPFQLSMTLFALSIIIIGAKRSVTELIKEFKKIHVDKRGGHDADQGIETMTKEDAMQFPLYAGGMLCSMYGLIKVFGKEIVNPLLLSYMGFGGSQTIKSLLLDTFPD